MSEAKMDQMVWCSKELMDTREELESTRRMNKHLNNILDKKVAQLDKANGKLQQITDSIRDNCTGNRSEGITMDDIMYIMEWKR